MTTEPLRFVATGLIATTIQYAVYWLLIDYIGVSAALTVGYVISLICNFILTTYFTFHVKPTKRKVVGFAFSHAVNWSIQLLSLNLFILLGVPKAFAPLPMYMVCVPINFFLVRFFVKKM